ncbi:MAG TPA: hypothetical protein PLO37_11060 [Candidatus Hydrogenedentes bacterium]|nr:hypothetical protein [Candidatus Hydrogenedentota bacterium]HPG67377.1 hypothetical protein [Candidatus Hydrogenedentota bacterium]
MRPIAAIAMLVCTCALGGWAQDAGSDDLGGYTKLKVKADRLTGGLDGTIQRLEGNARITLLSDDPDLEPLPIQADLVTFTYPDDGAKRPSRILLDGHVVIEHPSGTFRAERGEWDFEKDTLEFTGNPVIDTPEISGFRGGKIIISLSENTFDVIGGGSVDLIDLSGSGEPSKGSAWMLKDADVSDWSAFLTRFKEQCGAESPTPGNHILGLFDPEAKTLMSRVTVDEMLALKDKFLDKLNEAMARPDFYDATAWKGVELSAPATELLKARDGGEIAPADLRRLNRLLFEAAYAGMIRSAGGSPTP